MTSATAAARDSIMITGIGAVSPLGSSVAEITANLLAGASGVRSIPPHAFARESRQFAAPLTGIPPPPAGTCHLDAAAFAALPRLDRLCLSPITHALADAALPAGTPRTRIGLVLGQGAEHMKVWDFDFLDHGTLVFEPRQGRSLVHRLAEHAGIAGPAVTAAAACASSGYAMALGRTSTANF